jgi:hypothetical protein
MFKKIWILQEHVRKTCYGAHIDRIERVQRKFVRYALRGLGWTDMCDLPPYVDRCALIRLETLNGAVRSFNEFADGLFDLHLSRNQFFNRLRSVL